MTNKSDRYNETTKEQRKMARLIAADVLKHMRYFNITNKGNYCLSLALQGQDIQSTPLKEFRKCEVCARGAMFLSRAILFDEAVFPSDLSQGCVVRATTATDIGYYNAGLIESAFEQRGLSGYRTLGDRDRAVAFGRSISDPRARLRTIMKNVIANKGVFIPPVVKAKAKA